MQEDVQECTHYENTFLSGLWEKQAVYLQFLF